MITAVVGAGGKTTLIHSLAKKYLNEGKRVLVTTTTHMLIEQDTLLTDDPEEIKSRLITTGYVMAGIPKGEKITALSEDTFSKVCKWADEVLVEADGAKHFLLKIPNETEPVIPENTDRIIIVYGSAALGRPAEKTIFRLNSVSDSYGIKDNSIVNTDIIQTLIRKGYLNKLMEKYSDKEITVYASGAGSLYEKAVGALINADLDVNLIDEKWFGSKPCLFICGAGHVAKELAYFADRIGMKVKVMDPRIEWANKERFPNAEIINDDFNELERYLIPNAYYAVLTPGHADDLYCVSTIMNTDYNYLGMIGSHNKVDKTIARLKKMNFSGEQISTLHAPIGLSIGANTPAEIAVSIIAEIISIKNKSALSSASEELLGTNLSGMLCIIIDKQGSSPRDAGSMMLVTKDRVIDTIGGGPVENKAIEDARNNNKAFIREYYLDDSEGSNLGMVCGGKNTVLFIPV